MADKKKMKQRKVEEEKPTKEEYAVAKYLRFNLPPREGKLHGMEVQCFFGNAAVDKLLESKWSAAKNAKEPLFTNRVSCVSYLLGLLEKGLFHRAERDKRKKDKDDKEKPKKRKKEKEEKDESTAAEDDARERKGKKDKKSKKEIQTAEEADGEKKTEKKDEKKKKEKRLKLVMPDQQFFEDSDEVYVWIYDPVNAKNFLIGLLMVLGAIALCMFPLWPPEVRTGVYYLSLSAAGFVGFILSLVVVRLIMFCCIWVLTVGRHHLWLLPNLTEDVGFFDSFKPLYKYEYVPKGDGQKAIKDGDKKKKGKKSQKGKKDKSSDKEDSDEFEVIKKEELSENATDEDKDMDEGEEADDNELNEVDEEEDDAEDINDDENVETDEENEENDDDSESTDKKKTN
ncbi:translocation protein SEC62 [Elysia marginata]|uniref:Translocation protein SEC62 n=1 Tax=Elysia marginata TaxID=1093978 RepID=A0AAV4GEV9_9GAST|nr:translocation protein SEC62 [Elysia marginata]